MIARVSFLCVLLTNICYTKTFVVPELKHFHHKLSLKDEHHRTSWPYIAADTFRAISDHRIDEARVPFNPHKVRYADIIFLNPDYMAFFFEHINPHIKQPYILVTHNSIEPVPGACKKYLDDEKVLAWFGKNADIKAHVKMKHLPLGLANSYWRHGDISVVDKARALLPIKKKHLLYMNFAIVTHKEQRQELHDLFENKSFCYVSHRKPYLDYLKDLGASYFVLSPRGTGVDCYRTWEALLMGSYPIVKTSFLDPLFQDLPVIIVKDWKEITEDFLQKKYKEFSQKTFNMDKIFAPYWIDQIKNLQERSRAIQYN